MNMMFSRNDRRTNPSFNRGNVQTIKQIQKEKPNVLMLPLTYNARPRPQIEEPKRPEYNPYQKQAPKMLWGKPTWYFLHCLGEKLKESEFGRIRNELLKYVYSICTNLPCPYCSAHAKDYMNRLNFNLIQSKSQLVDLLYTFHNAVNKQKGYEMFSHNDLHETYSKMNFREVINLFMHHFSDRHRSQKLMVNDLQRKQIVTELKQFLIENLQFFEN